VACGLREGAVGVALRLSGGVTGRGAYERRAGSPSGSTILEDEAEIAWALFLSLHAVRVRLACLEAKLGVRTAADGVARALREST
jgi:hypothetical protein